MNCQDIFDKGDNDEGDDAEGDDDKAGLGNKVEGDTKFEDTNNESWETIEYHSRDAAVESKNAAEVDLARNRIEMMQVGQSVFD